ncbi:MAG: NUDIX domain-containing protein [Gemmatimonadaceae bacterium]|nr:NUDIX domain-containing protein [Gemmatimonadaceae bacterium]
MTTDWSSVPTFGVASGRFPLRDRPSAYAIISHSAAQLAVVRTAAGYFLPGGGIEARESVEDAVLREVTEECGFTVALSTWRAFATEVVCSEAESTEFIKRSTFCEATLDVPHLSGGAGFDIEWHAVDAVCELLAPVSHRWAVREWERLAPDAIDSVHYNRNFIVTHKAAACVVRTRARGPEVLVFRHPLAGVQIPKGSIELGETAADAAARELAEESGILEGRVLRQVGWHQFEVGEDATSSEPSERQVWHTFLMAADAEQRDSWSQHASGSEVEASLVFEFFWLPLAEARTVLAQRYVPSVDFVAAAITADPALRLAHRSNTP